MMRRLRPACITCAVSELVAATAAAAARNTRRRRRRNTEIDVMASGVKLQVVLKFLSDAKRFCRLRFSSSKCRVPVYLLQAGQDTRKFSIVMSPPSVLAMLCATSQPEGFKQQTLSPHISQTPERQNWDERKFASADMQLACHRNTVCLCELPILATCDMC